MITLDKLTSISESAGGFTASDVIPTLSLEEACARLPAIILEGAYDIEVAIGKGNEEMVSAFAINNEAAHLQAIQEGVFDTLKIKIKSAFQKIKAWLKSIIAKVTVYIDRIFKSGKDLYDKYKNKPEFNKDYKEFKANGYKKLFADKSPFEKVEGLDPSVLLDTTIAVKVEAMDSLINNNDATAIDNMTENLEKLDDDSVIGGIVQSLIPSVKTDGSDWKSDVREELWGDKEELDFGTDFNKETLGGILSKPEKLKAIANTYTKLYQAADKAEAKITKGIGTYDEGVEDATKTASDKFFTKYVSGFKHVMSVVSSVQSIRQSYETERMNQAKSIFGKMLSYNPKKASSESSDIEGFEDYTLDMDM